MRVLITFLAVSFFAFSIASAKEKSTADAKKFVIESAKNLKQTFSKNGKRAFSFDDQTERFNLIHQTNQHHAVYSPLFAATASFTVNIISDRLIIVYAHFTKSSYQIILNCLYPKHSFW